MSSSSYAHFATSNTAITAQTTTPRSANVSPQPRVFSIASLLNDPPPDQQPQLHHHYHHHQRKVAPRLTVLEKENHHHLDVLSSDPDDEMAPPKKPNSSQRRRPVPTAPVRLDSPIDSQPATGHAVAAAMPPAREAAQRPQQTQRQRQRQHEVERDEDQDQQPTKHTSSILSLTGAISKKKESIPPTKSQAKAVDTAIMTQQRGIELPSEDEKHCLQQDDADRRGHGVLGKPATLQKPKVDATPKANNSVPRSKTITDIKEPASAKKKPIPTLQNPNYNSKDDVKVETPEKSEEAVLRNHVAVASTEGKQPDIAKKVGPVSQKNATQSPTKRSPLPGIHMADAARTPPRVTTPRGAKRSQSMSSSENESQFPSQFIKKLRTTVAANTSNHSSRVASREHSEDDTSTPASGVPQPSAGVSQKTANGFKAQFQPHTETLLRSTETDNDVQMTSEKPESPVAPKATVRDGKDVGSENGFSSVEKGDLMLAMAQQKKTGTNHKAEQEESRAELVEKAKEEIPIKKEKAKIQKNDQYDQEEFLINKAKEEAAQFQPLKKRKIVITRRSSTLPITTASPTPAHASDTFSGLPYIVSNHRWSSDDHFEFLLEIMRPGVAQPLWVEEAHLFMESPETVVKYWDSVDGGRDQVCDGMWKIYRIWDEQKIGRKTRYLVGWIGSLDRGWEWRNMLLANAKEVLIDWEEQQAAKLAQKQAKEEGTDYDFGDQQQQAEQDDDDDEPLVKQYQVANKSRSSLSKTERASAATAKKIKFVSRKGQK